MLAVVLSPVRGAASAPSDAELLRQQLDDCLSKLRQTEATKVAVEASPDDYDNVPETLRLLNETIRTQNLRKAALEARLRAASAPAPGVGPSQDWEAMDPRYKALSLAADQPAACVPVDAQARALSDALPSEEELETSVGVVGEISKKNLAKLGRYLPAESIAAGSAMSRYIRVGNLAKWGCRTLGILDVTKTFALDQNVMGAGGKTLGLVIGELAPKAAAAAAGSGGGALIAAAPLAIGAEVQYLLVYTLSVQIQEEQWTTITKDRADAQALARVHEECAHGSKKVRFACGILPAVGGL